MPVGAARHLVVGDEDGGDADAVDDLLQPRAQALAHLRVQRTERLVQQQQPAQGQSC